MQAIYVKKQGGPEALEFTKGEKPQPKAGQVQIQVKAAGINPVDLLLTAGYVPLRTLPFTLGFDGAGIISAVGEGVTKWKVGDRVWFFLSEVGDFPNGAFAEYTVCTEKDVGRLPERVSFEKGSALGIPYNTAVRTLFHTVNARPGETVLIHGASGAAGIACVQVAYGAGCTVWGTAGTEEGLEMLKKMHVARVFNHRKEGYVNEIKEASGGRGVDVIIEMVANANLPTDLTLIRQQGRVAIIGNKGPHTMDAFLYMAMEAKVSGISVFGATEEQQREAFAVIDRGLELGYIDPVVWKTLPLKDTVLAFKELGGSSGRKGKIALLP